MSNKPERKRMLVIKVSQRAKCVLSRMSGCWDNRVSVDMCDNLFCTFAGLLISSLAWCMTTAVEAQSGCARRVSGQHICYAWCLNTLSLFLYCVSKRSLYTSASLNGSTQFHYCTDSNPGTGADDAFVLKRGVWRVTCDVTPHGLHTADRR